MTSLMGRVDFSQASMRMSNIPDSLCYFGHAMLWVLKFISHGRIEVRRRLIYLIARLVIKSKANPAMLAIITNT